MVVCRISLLEHFFRVSNREADNFYDANHGEFGCSHYVDQVNWLAFGIRILIVKVFCKGQIGIDDSLSLVSVDLQLKVVVDLYNVVFLGYLSLLFKLVAFGNLKHNVLLVRRAGREEEPDD